MKQNVGLFLFLVIIGFVTTSCQDFLDEEFGRYTLHSYALSPGGSDTYHDEEFNLAWTCYSAGNSFQLAGNNGEIIEIVGIGRMEGVVKSKLRLANYIEATTASKHSRISFFPVQGPSQIGWFINWTGEESFYINNSTGVAFRITNVKKNKIGYFLMWNQFSNRTNNLYFQRVKSIEERINK